MLKLLFTNEEDTLEIIYTDRVFVDPEAPTDIVITSVTNFIRVRIRFTDTDEANNFMEVLFEGDKINLAEIANDNPNMEITVEEEANPFLSMNPEYFANFEDFDDDDEDEDDDEE